MVQTQNSKPSFPFRTPPGVTLASMHRRSPDGRWFSFFGFQQKQSDTWGCIVDVLWIIDVVWMCSGCIPSGNQRPCVEIHENLLSMGI